MRVLSRQVVTEHSHFFCRRVIEKSHLVNPGTGDVKTETFRTAGVAAAYVTLARPSTRIT
jgi:hypothetical protein